MDFSRDANSVEQQAKRKTAKVRDRYCRVLSRVLKERTKKLGARVNTVSIFIYQDLDGKWGGASYVPTGRETSDTLEAIVSPMNCRAGAKLTAN